MLLVMIKKQEKKKEREKKKKQSHLLYIGSDLSKRIEKEEKESERFISSEVLSIGIELTWVCRRSTMDAGFLIGMLTLSIEVFDSQYSMLAAVRLQRQRMVKSLVGSSLFGMNERILD